MPFNLSEITTATQGHLLHADQQDSQPLRIETDSRRISGPCIFWALRGEQFDGHEFISAASKAGAVACVVEDSHQSHVPQDTPCVVVADSTLALADLARWHRSRLKVKVVGITGSFGKTTTREMVAAALSARLRVFQSKKNFNNHIGLPLCLLELTDDYDVAVLELGASGVGEIEGLCEIAKPDLGIITGIGRAHSKGFGGIEKTTVAKGELAAALPTSGRLFLTSSEPRHGQLAGLARCPVTFVGTQISDDVYASHVSMRGARLLIVVDSHEYAVSVAGPHFTRNVLLAIAVARELGLSPDEISQGLSDFQPAPGRCQVRDLGAWTVIDDTYNASPEAMIAACQALGRWPTEGHRILVCGDMLELGTDSLSGHQDVGITAVEAGVDVVLSYGMLARTVVETALSAGLLPENAGSFTDLDELLERLKSELHLGDVVLVKGSRSMRMERVVDWLVNEAEVMRVDV